MIDETRAGHFTFEKTVARKFVRDNSTGIRRSLASFLAQLIDNDPPSHARPQGDNVFSKSRPAGSVREENMNVANFDGMSLTPILFVDYDMLTLNWKIESAESFLHIWPRKRRMIECYFCLRVGFEGPVRSGLLTSEVMDRDRTGPANY